jgi:hypothetical protein
MTERAADMAEVPGGGTGLLVRQYQGGAPIYKVFAQAVAPPAKEEERDEDDEFGGQSGHGGFNGPGAWMR